MTAHDEAVKAAAEALRARSRAWAASGRWQAPSFEETAEAALTAAAPFLRAEGAAAERQRIAAAIRANCCSFDGCNATSCMAHAHAARIAEAGP